MPVTLALLVTFIKFIDRLVLCLKFIGHPEFGLDGKIQKESNASLL